MLNEIRSLLKDESGQAMVEYGIILGLVAVVVIIALTAMGDQIKALFENIKQKITPATTGS